MQASPKAWPSQPPSQITTTLQVTATRTRHGCLPHALGGARHQHTHRAHTIPLAKSLSIRLPSPRATPTGRSDYTPGAGAATLARKGPGHTYQRSATPQDRKGAQGGTGGAAEAPSLLRQAGCLRPFPAPESAVNATSGTPPARASPKRISSPPPGARSRLPQGLGYEAGEVGTSGAHGGGGGSGVCGRIEVARLCGRGRRAAPQPRNLAAAGASRAQ